MAFFTTYTTLQATIASYLARTDLTVQIPEFIRLAENRLVRDLRIRQMIKVATSETEAGKSIVALPSDFMAMKDLHLQGNPPQTVKFLSTSNFFRNAQTAVSGLPNKYTLLGSEFQFAPIPDSKYTLQMVYFYQPEYLSETNSSNLWLAETPDLLLYASLGEAEPYLMNDERLATWASMYDKGMIALRKSDSESEYPATPLTITNSIR